MKAVVTFITVVSLLSSASPALAASVPQTIDPYRTALTYVESTNILEPMSDGLMHSEMPISREDLVTSVVKGVYTKDIRSDCFDRISSRVHTQFTHLFTDVPIVHTSAQEICVGMFVGLVEGQENGTFGMHRSANLVEAAKVITKAYGIAPLPGLVPETRVPWHEPYWFALAKRGAIPETVKNRESILTRGEFAEILYRLREERPAQGFRYQSTFVREIAQDSRLSKVTDSLSAASPSLRESRYNSSDPQNLSAGLLLQMHTEQRRQLRMTRTVDVVQSTESIELHSSAHST